jgi:hypothetical protein
LISPLHRRTEAAAASLPTRRSYSTTATKSDEEGKTFIDDHDPDNRAAINTERYEYSKSGSDSAVAEQKCAWDIQNKTPDAVREASYQEQLAKGDGKMSPLEVSPANQDVSKFTDEDGRGVYVVHNQSRRVSPRKGKKVELGPTAAIEPPSGHDETAKV